MTENEKMNAFVWASKVAPGAIPMFALKKGQQFFWTNDSKTYVKTYRGRGWYVSNGKTYRCGTRAAVIEA
jgi:hypothetical protein